MVVNEKTLAKSYRREYKKSSYQVTEEQYVKIVTALTQSILTNIMNGSFVKLPLNMGEFRFFKYKSNKRIIDWKHTKELGKYVYMQNFHSDGYRYRFKWEKDKARFTGRLVYGFKLNRKISRAIAKGIKENKLEFLSL